MRLAGAASANLVPKTRSGRRPGSKRLSAMYCIPHDEAGTRGWQVQVPGHPSEFFADSKHGGQAGAFRKGPRAAATLADPSRVNLKTRRFVRAPGKREGSSESSLKRPRIGSLNGRPSGKTKQARFSVSKWGEQAAERQARAERAKRVAGVLR